MVLAWIVLSVVVGIICLNKTPGFFGGLVVSLLLSPIVGFIIYMVSDDKAPKVIVNVNESEIAELKAKIEALENK